MRGRLIALATLASVLAFAPSAMAFGGGGGHKGGGGGDFSASFVNGGQAGAGGAGSNASGASNGVTASEPLAALAVGLGLLGARYLRRR